MTLIGRWECPHHGETRLQFREGSLTEPRVRVCLCGREAVYVEYVPAEQLRGAVGALRKIRERMDKEPDDEMLDDILAIVDGVLYPPTGGQ